MSLKVNDRTLYVVPERSPEEQPRFTAMGKTRKVLEDKQRGQDWTLSFAHRPNYHVNMLRDGSDPQRLLTITAKGEIQWATNTQTLIGASPAELSAAMQ